MKTIMYVLNPKYMLCTFILGFLYGYFETHNQLNLSFLEDMVILFCIVISWGLIMAQFFNDSPVGPPTAILVALVSIYNFINFPYQDRIDYFDLGLFIIALGSFLLFMIKYYYLAKENNHNDTKDE